MLACACVLGIVPLSVAQGSGSYDNFYGPNVKAQYAPDRDYDLIHIDVTVNVDWPHRVFSGDVIDTLAPLRDGLDRIQLDAGPNLNIKSVKVDGQDDTFKHEGKKLWIDSGPIPCGKAVNVEVVYVSVNALGRGFAQGGEGGWHWIQTQIGNPNRIGFWTQGETGYNSNWVPLWDYPNDFATSETHTTVPADWTVIGNGILVSNRLSADGKTRTFDWKLDIPHATYLLTLCGGPFDVAHDDWRGVPLWYVVPKGEGNLIPESFGHTKDMLSFYSDSIGYKFPWPKYAQDALYDFGGGMENASATSLGEGSLTDERSGYYGMDSLNSHEMGHQWFGDTVTTKDWGQIWLNESFATYMQIMYFGHSRGRNGYDREVENAMQAYFGESRRYERPIVTNRYANADAMFDEHTYPKGAVVLHTLHKMLGDQAFFAGLKHYLELHQHTPVETNDLCESMTDATGINLHPFFDQWIFKPGHPVIDTTWTWNSAANNVVVHVSQKQDTSNGTPIYDVKTAVGIIDGNSIDEVPVELSAKEQDFTIHRAAKPDAVLFDPEHNFLREMAAYHWDKSELPFILRTAPNCIDKNRAMRMMLDGTPSDADVQTVVDFLKTDDSQFPAIESYFPLTEMKKESLRPFFMSELRHKALTRVINAMSGLAALAPNSEVTTDFRGMIDDKHPYAEVREAMSALADWDMKGNLDVILKATHIPSLRNNVRSSALAILARSHSADALKMLLKDAAASQPTDIRSTAIMALADIETDNKDAHDAISAAINDPDPAIEYAGAQAAERSSDKTFVPDLQKLMAKPDLADPDHFKPFLQRVIEEIS